MKLVVIKNNFQDFLVQNYYVFRITVIYVSTFDQKIQEILQLYLLHYDSFNFAKQQLKLATFIKLYNISDFVTDTKK